MVSGQVDLSSNRGPTTEEQPHQFKIAHLDRDEEWREALFIDSVDVDAAVQAQRRRAYAPFPASQSSTAVGTAASAARSSVQRGARASFLQA